MEKNKRVFEIHQGEWTYLTTLDSYELIATANVAECTVFYGFSVSGFAFMFHHDFPCRPRDKTNHTFLYAIELNVPRGEKIFCFITGGWTFLWSCYVRRQYKKLIEEIEAKGYEVVL